MMEKRSQSFKQAVKNVDLKRTSSEQQTSRATHSSFANTVLLTMNLLKSPWILSRCKKTLDHVQVIQNWVRKCDNLKAIVKLTPGSNSERFFLLISQKISQKPILFTHQSSFCDTLNDSRHLKPSLKTRTNFKTEKNFFQEKSSFSPTHSHTVSNPNHKFHFHKNVTTLIPPSNNNEKGENINLSKLESEYEGVEIEEDVVLGVNLNTKSEVKVGLVFLVTIDTDISLDGDGGFIISSFGGEKFHFQPVSVQEMWTAVQAFVKTIFSARKRHRDKGSLCTHEKSSLFQYYSQQPHSSGHQFFEWQRSHDDFSTSFFQQFNENTERVQLKKQVRRKLQEVMVNEDLENVTSKQVRDKLELMMKVDLADELGMSKGHFKQYIDEEMIIVMRQMDSPSQILDFLFLGSEWNASNLDELRKNGIGYILNVTKEIDNFFPGMFKYCNVRVYDQEESELLKHWDNTFRFIAEAREKKLKVLVHCKMGVSRSASTVIAYLMKGYRFSVEEAFQLVKQRRECVQPNPGFMQQLIIYQGILDASNQRHSRLFRSKSISSVKEKSSRMSPRLRQFKESIFSNCNKRELEKVNGNVETERNFKEEQQDKLQPLIKRNFSNFSLIQKSKSFPISSNWKLPSLLSQPVSISAQQSSNEDTFVIVDVDRDCLRVALDTLKSQSFADDDGEEENMSENFKLSSSSVLKNWSCHSPFHIVTLNNREVLEKKIVDLNSSNQEFNTGDLERVFKWKSWPSIFYPSMFLVSNNSKASVTQSGIKVQGLSSKKREALARKYHSMDID